MCESTVIPTAVENIFYIDRIIPYLVEAFLCFDRNHNLFRFPQIQNHTLRSPLFRYFEIS